MFGNFKLSRTSSPAPTQSQPSVSKGPDSSKGTTSTSAHPDLASRSSRTPAPGEGSSAPRRAFLGRSMALSSEGKASAAAAAPPRPKVGFAKHAMVYEDDQAPRRTRVEFGPKPEPKKTVASSSTHAPGPSTSRVSSAPEQHAQTQRFSGGPSRPQGPTTGQPAVRPPSAQAQAQAGVAGAGNRSELSPTEKFKKSFETFMKQCPDKRLSAELKDHLDNGRIRQFRELAGIGVNSTDPTSAGLLMSMGRSLHKMNGDYSGLRPPRQLGQTSAAGAGSSTERSPAQKFNSRLATFMEQCPDKALKDKLGSLLAGGQLDAFRKEASAVAKGTGDQKLVGLLQPMLKALHDMNGDFSNLVINIPRPKA